MENNNGRGIFYGVMGVATLVVAIVGATFAYFAASTNGAAGAVATNSANVSGTLSITEDAKLVTNDLIPATNAVMLSSFAQSGTGNKAKCRAASESDVKGDYGICSYYTFTLTNGATVAQNIYLSLSTETNTYEKAGDVQNLEYCVYEGTTTDTVTKACGSVPDAGKSEQITSVSLGAGLTKQYTVVVYLKEAGDQTTANSGKSYSGTVNASTSDGSSNVTGKIAA